jgi:nicotinamide phosphoribosyltransferase
MLGPKGEIATAEKIIAQNSGQIVSIVADSYDYYNFVQKMASLKELIRTYNVRLVIRPDSCTSAHPSPASLVLWTLQELELLLGCTINGKGYKVVPYKVLWGDGIDAEGIKEITNTVIGAGYCVSNLVFGMGGGLLQKVNRDTFKFAIKASAYSTDGTNWIDVQKNPLDQSKASKPGRQHRGLTKVFENGIITSSPDPNELRFN